MPPKWRGPHDWHREGRRWEPNNSDDSASTWVRTTRSRPCPICGKPDWCGIASDGTVAVCMRVQSDRPTRNNGFLHVLDEQRRRRTPVVRLPVNQYRDPEELEALALQWNHDAMRRLRHFEAFASGLRLEPEQLARFGVGWTGHEWSFPMRDANGNCIGIRLRRPRTGFSDAKYSVKGSREGLFIPTGVPSHGKLFLAEGPTDACAFLQIGCDAIGRPNCKGGENLAIELSRNHDVIVVADRDQPGVKGAQHLAQRLLLVARTVRLLVPPAPWKDAREWLTQTRTPHEQFLAHVHRLPVLTLTVRMR